MREYQLRPIKFLWQLLSKTISEAKVYILGYRSYTALLTQVDVDDPIAKVLENTIGDIVWTRSSIGEYYGTLTGAFGDGSKVFISNPYVFVATKAAIFISYNDTNSMVIGTYGYPAWNTEINTDDALQDFPIEIRIYN